MDNDTEKPVISIGLDISGFDEVDARDIEERLESHFRVSASPFVDLSGPIEPHVIVQLAAATLPLLSDVLVNLFSAGLYDVVRSRLSQSGREEEVTRYEVSVVDESGRVSYYLEGRTRDREIIKDLIQQARDTASRSSNDD